MRTLVTLCLVLSAAPAAAQSLYGPQASITCPGGSTLLETTDDIPAIVWAAANGTAFCVEAGTHTPTAPINMREGQSLTGQLGAIIDGTNVVQGFDLPSTSIIRGWGCSVSCSNVTIRNLVITGLGGDGTNSFNCVGIVGSGSAADNWVVEYNEISECGFGVNVGFNDTTTVRFNYIHDNDQGDNPAALGGYGGNETVALLFDRNYFANNGNKQKVSITDGTIFRDNRFLNDVIWLDGDNVNWIVEGNHVTGCGGEAFIGLHVEISALGIVRHNRFVNCPAGSAMFLNTVRDTEVYGNNIVNARRGLNLFVDCNAVFPAGQPQATNIGWDTNNMNVHDNVVMMFPDNVRAAELTATNCDAMELEPYLDGTKNVDFEVNTYLVQNVGGTYWEWGTDITTFATWQGEGRDDTGSVSTFRPEEDATGDPVDPPAPADTAAPIVTASARRPGNATKLQIASTCSDAVGCVRFVLTMDGRIISTTTGALTVPASRGPHLLTAQGWDAAGNASAIASASVAK